MSNILIFPTPPRRSPAGSVDHRGVILFFTGVRYERLASGEASTEAAEPAPPKIAERLQRKAAASKRTAGPKTRSTTDGRKGRAKAAAKLVGNGGKTPGKRRA